MKGWLRRLLDGPGLEDELRKEALTLFLEGKELLAEAERAGLAFRPWAKALRRALKAGDWE